MAFDESPASSASGRRLIVVSNRLPVVFQRDEGSGALRAVPAAGGLVTALLPVLRHRGGIWIGWTGSDATEAELQTATRAAEQETGYRMIGVGLTQGEVNDFYLGFSNRIIWPLFHDLQSLCDFDPVFWRTYAQVNRKYAQVVHEVVEPRDLLWVHDYHLMNVAADLRALNATLRIAFFLHIPFPPLDLFVKLPWRMAVLQALLQFDVVGFQTLRDRRNFTDCVRTLMPGMLLSGRGNFVEASAAGRTVRIGSFPISIDYHQFERQARSPQVSQRALELRRRLPDRKLMLGIDRLDYTKGIPHRLKAFRNALLRHPQMHDRLSLIQVVVPSREDITEYQHLKLEIEHLVGEINGEFSRPGGWVPVWYVYTSLNRVDLLAYYRAAHIALITPLKDGMNLVAKEYCASSIEEDCVLILSEFAGAASQLHRGALLVNPYDIEGVADAIHRAWAMPEPECRARMRRLRRQVREHDVYRWLDQYLGVAFAQHLRDYPPLPDAAYSQPDHLPI